MKSYSAILSSLQQIVVATKSDICDDPERINKFKDYIINKGLEFYVISAPTKTGIKELINAISKKLHDLPPVKVYEPEVSEEQVIADEKDNREVSVRRENDRYYVEGKWLLRVMGSVNFDEEESVNYFQRVLRKSGIIDMLEEKGIKDNDTVSIYGYEFDYLK